MSVASVQVQFVPLMAVALRPAGSVSVMVTAPVAGAVPVFRTVTL